jgi:hypothetical protein
MAQEQACESTMTADTSADIYSLGVILYEPLTTQVSGFPEQSSGNFVSSLHPVSTDLHIAPNQAHTGNCHRSQTRLANTGPQTCSRVLFTVKCF